MSKPAPKLENPVQMAVIGAAHGIRGEVKVRSFAEDPMSLGRYGPLQAGDGRRFTVSGVRQAGQSVVVRFAEIPDRTAAETLSGTALFIDRSALPDILDEEEFYQTDLVGLDAFEAGGEPVGAVVAVHDFGAGIILELRLAGGRSAMVPFTRAAVPSVEIAARRMTIDPAAAGLVDGGDEA